MRTMSVAESAGDGHGPSQCGSPPWRGHLTSSLPKSENKIVADSSYSYPFLGLWEECLLQSNPVWLAHRACKEVSQRVIVIGMGPVRFGLSAKFIFVGR